MKISFINVSHHILWIMLHKKKMCFTKIKTIVKQQKKNITAWWFIFSLVIRNTFTVGIFLGMLESMKCKQTNNKKKQHKNNKMKMKWKMFQLQSLYEYFIWFSLIIFGKKKQENSNILFSLWKIKATLHFHASKIKMKFFVFFYEF